jgi:hypothetical protein
MFRSEINKLMENVLESGQPWAYVSPPVFLTQLAQLHVANAERAAMRMLEESEKELGQGDDSQAVPFGSASARKIMQWYGDAPFPEQHGIRSTQSFFITNPMGRLD